MEIVEKIEDVIFSNLFNDTSYAKAVLPFIDTTYFTEHFEQIIYEKIYDHFENYDVIPTKDSIVIDIEQSDGVVDKEYADVLAYLKGLEYTEVDYNWLIDKTEKFCQDKALYNALSTSIDIVNSGKDSSNIPTIMSDALSVCFDNHIGLDYLADTDDLFDYYHEEISQIPFDIDYFNDITKGGFGRKTLNVLMAAPGVGKSTFMCHFAAANIVSGYNVLYISLEMSEARLATRVDANLLNLTIDELNKIDREKYYSKVERMKKTVKGNMIFHEYPTSSAHVGHFKSLLEDLRNKKQFVPDVVYVDYLNICAAQRSSDSGDGYAHIKTISEELRALAVERNIVIVTATQVNRSGAKTTDFDMTDTSESFGLPATVDTQIAIISTPELEEGKQILIKQLKNRYADVNYKTKGVIGIDRSKMRLYNLESDSQNIIMPGSPEEVTEKMNDFKSKSRSKARAGSFDFT